MAVELLEWGMSYGRLVNVRCTKCGRVYRLLESEDPARYVCDRLEGRGLDGPVHCGGALARDPAPARPATGSAAPLGVAAGGAVIGGMIGGPVGAAIGGALGWLLGAAGERR